jgi:hypothetical protein
MISKIFKAVWFVTVFAFVVVLMYIYAGLPEEVEVMQAGNMYMLLGRESFFYVYLGIAALANFLIYSYYSISKKTAEDNLLSWTMGLGILLNLFFIVSMNFIGLYNSLDNIEYRFSGTLLFVAVALLSIWLISWPLYSIFRKYFIKA